VRTVLRYAITAVVLIVVGVFFAQSLSENWAEVQEAKLDFDGRMIVATLLFALAVPLSGVLWGRMVNRLSPAPEPHAGVLESIAVHCASWLLKYVPGQVGSLVNKVAWGQRRGFSRTLIVITFIYENVFLVIAAVVPSVVILALSLGVEVLGDNFGTLALPLLAVVPLLLIANRRVFKLMLAPLVKRALKRDVPDEYFLSTPATVSYQLGYVGPRLMNGLGYVFVVASVTDVAPDAWLPLAAAYMLAGAAGLLAVFVPSGLGVREAVIVLFASQYMPLGTAIITSLLARLLSTLADALVAAIYAGLRFTIPRDPEPVTS